MIPIWTKHNRTLLKTLITFATIIHFQYFLHHLKALNLSFQTVQKYSKTDKSSESYETIERGGFSTAKIALKWRMLKNCNKKSGPGFVRGFKNPKPDFQPPVFWSEGRQKNRKKTKSDLLLFVFFCFFGFLVFWFFEPKNAT